MSSRIYLSPPHLGPLESQFVHEAFASNWISSVGPNLTAFEEEMGERLGRHCVATSSGTAAIHLGLRLLGVGKGDEVWCPTFTFVATANPILYEGATPVFFDSERVSWNLDPDLLADALAAAARTGRLPKAVIVVDLFGQTADLQRIADLCASYDVPVLEDAAEALGSDHRGRPAGAFGAVAVISFNGNKIITTSGGGMLAAPDAESAQRARHWATQSRDPGLAYEHSELGYNYRMSNVLAGIGRGQLRVLDDRVAQKRALAQRYALAFADLDGFQLAPEAPWGTHTRWLTCFSLAPGHPVRRDDVIAALSSENIEARPVWKPMHMQPLFRECRSVGGALAEDLFQRSLCLPSGTNMSRDDEERVISIVRETVAPARGVRLASGEMR